MVAGAKAVLSRRDCLCGNLNLNTQNCQRELPDLITEDKKRELSPPACLVALSGFSIPGQSTFNADGCFFNKNHVRLSILNAVIMCNGKHRAKFVIIIKNMKTWEAFQSS